MSLCKLREKDLPLILSWRNAPEVRKSMHSDQKISAQEHKTWFSNLKHSLSSYWYIYKNQEKIPVGVVYFTDYQPEKKRSSWGFYTAPNSPKGTGTNLGLNAINQAFDQLGLETLNAEVLSTNLRSLYLHKKLGFIIQSNNSGTQENNLISVIHLTLSKSNWFVTKEKISSIIK